MKAEEVKAKVKQVKRCVNCQHVSDPVRLPLIEVMVRKCVEGTTSFGVVNENEFFCSKFKAIGMVEKCSNCKHWDHIGVQFGESDGLCTVNPPVIIEDDTVFPCTDPGQRCGRFEASCRAIAALAADSTSEAKTEVAAGAAIN